MSGIEQRKSKRYKLEKWVKGRANGRDVICRVMDISEKGLGISKSGLLGIKSHDKITVELEAIGKVTGIVTWAGQISFGVALKLDTETERRMEKFILQLAGKTLQVS